MTRLQIAVLAGSAVGLPAAAPNSGWEAYSAGRFTDAVAIWTQGAIAGDAESQFGLGIAYDLGVGVARDEARACQWYRRAGEAGVSAAAFDMAVMLDQGRCGTRNAALAANWYGRAAAAGHARAQYDLAQLYETGDGVPQNLDQATAWYQAASAQGLSAATQKVAALSARARTVQDGPPRPVLPATPADGPLSDRGLPTPFVWSVPQQPGPVRFFLEVYALGAHGAREVVASYTDQSAALVGLQPGSANYAWRVFTVATDGRHYAVSDWRQFEVAGRTAQ